LLVIPSHAINGGTAAAKVGAIQGQPYAGWKIVYDVPLHQINRRLRERAAVEEISVIGEKCNARDNL
jgi:hypothetical protein